MNTLMILPRQINESYYDFPPGKVMSTLMIASKQINELNYDFPPGKVMNALMIPSLVKLWITPFIGLPDMKWFRLSIYEFL